MDNGQMFDHLKQEPRSIDLIVADLDAFWTDAVKKVCGREGMCINCCSGCASNNASFDYVGVDMRLQPVERWKLVAKIPKAKKQLSQLKKEYGWSKTKGFLKKDGCVLPRSKRSIYCQMTHCRAIDKFYTNNDWRRLSSLINELRTLRTKEKALI